MSAIPAAVRGKPRTLPASFVQFFTTPLTEDPLERRLSGRVAGMLWIGGGCVVLGRALVHRAGPPNLPLGLAIAVSLAAIGWGAVSVWALDWVNGPAWLGHLTAASGLVTLAAVVYLTGDAHSVGWQYFTWLALFGAVFFRPRVAIGFMLASLIAQALPLAFHPGRSLDEGSMWRLGLVVCGYGSVGLAVVRGAHVLRALRARAERAADVDPATLIGLQALARAIDAKDPATREHSERVAALAEALARIVGWDETQALALRDAALVHDVGKIGVDDAILRKAAALTPAEREHVNAHAEISGRIVEGVLDAEQVEWIRTHHERVDGSGYPQGLDGTQIPLGGRLLAIADAFDAMTAGRRYSAPRDPVDALSECRAQEGRQFSHEAVAALQAWLLMGPAEGGRAGAESAAPVISSRRGAASTAELLDTSRSLPTR